MEKIVIFWFRRDLRLDDNAGLYHALKSGLKVLPIFIFDENILHKLDSKNDARVDFIYKCLDKINKKLTEFNSSILVKIGKPDFIWNELITTYKIKSVYANHDYEPYAKERDTKVLEMLEKHKIDFHTFKDQVIFEKSEVTKDDGKPYTVFTPFSRKWKDKITDYYLKSYPNEKYFSNFTSFLHQFPTIKDIGFDENLVAFPSDNLNENIVKNYTIQRDFPAISGTSRLSVHLRFGSISIRKLAQNAFKLNETWLNELIWRDFYMMILHHFPHVTKGAFKHIYNQIEWRNNEQEFKAWCQGKTGYPIVDAGMRELNATGFMHNRVRMIVASFLTKHLLINWQWGEAYFAKKLLDFDLSANNGGWQWAAGCGCDAAPYFRVFNPYLQTEKFDKDRKYIKKWVPEFSDPFKYPKPIVVHDFARKRAIETYSKTLKSEV
ncbi:MAG: deoxyribodipyrimidine photo-lyase [Cytophagales bacterium]|nr:MAG: deoxyribodipyrimidine photo-lyase [Cytophagales bacterium]